MSLLEDIYSGKILPFFERNINTVSYIKALKLVCEAEEKLLQEFPECKELFDNFQDAQAKLLDEAYFQRFLLGFKVGAQLMDEMRKPLE